MGMEALFRWRDPRAGLQSPATIACAFDDFELASVLGETMLEAVLLDVRRWIDDGVDIGRVAINVSAAELRHPHYAERLLARIAAHGVSAGALELEITETALLADSDGRVLHALEALRAAGATIALDDFGTGFSSLSHLRHFPVDAIKIDQSFVAGSSSARATARSSRQCCGSARRWASPPSPKASRPRARPRSCAAAAASSRRVSCSRARSPRPTSPAFIAGRGAERRGSAALVPG